MDCERQTNERSSKRPCQSHDSRDSQVDTRDAISLQSSSTTAFAHAPQQKRKMEHDGEPEAEQRNEHAINVKVVIQRT